MPIIKQGKKRRVPLMKRKKFLTDYRKNGLFAKYLDLIDTRRRASEFFEFSKQLDPNAVPVFGVIQGDLENKESWTTY